MKHIYKKLLTLLGGATILALGVSCANLDLFSAKPVVLSEEGKTGYAIVMNAKPTLTESFAAEFLQKILKRKTGADFPIMTVDKVGSRGIYIGTEKPDGLKEDEYVFQTRGENIYLYGEGIHGAHSAMRGFIEDQLGVRWYESEEEPTVEVENAVVLKPFNKKAGYAFPYRILLNKYKWGYYQGCYMLQSETYYRDARRQKPYGEVDARQVSKMVVPAFIHTAYGYVPPDEEYYIKQKGEMVDWIRKKDWFATNPEFFPMEQGGKRTFNPDFTGRGNLCWGNKQLREVYAGLMEEQIMRAGENILLQIDLGDDGGNGPVCFCPECRRLADQYGNYGGALFDYVIELSEKLAGEHPKVRIRTAVRGNGKGKDFRADYGLPRTPGGKKLPNVDFWPTYKGANNHAPDKDPEAQRNLENYRELSKTGGIWVWVYPHLFGGDYTVPFTNLKNQQSIMQAIYETGAVKGLMFETYTYMCTFNPLERYVYVHLLRDPYRDIAPLVKEFTGFHYGQAAELARQYLEELEDAASNGKMRIEYSYSIINYQQEFAWLTLERIYRWQKLFDRMLELVEGNAKETDHLKLLRNTLDFVTLDRWLELARAYPDYFKDFEAVASRQHKLPKLYAGETKEKITMMRLNAKYGSDPKPLPDEFKNIDPARVIRLKPPRNNAAERLMKVPGKKRIVTDPDAAFGYASTVDWPAMPFIYGHHAFDEPQDSPANARGRIADLTLIIPGKYMLLKMDRPIRPTARSLLYVGTSWSCNTGHGFYFNVEQPALQYDAWVSVKFPEGYQGLRDKHELVLCDQIILVKKNHAE